jgi:nucleotide-binding universal stress UspA family protein
VAAKKEAEMSMRKVLIPLDGSEFSRKILRVVRSFFEPGDVELILFRAGNPGGAAPELTMQDAYLGAVPTGGSYDLYSRMLDSELATVAKIRDTYRAELVGELRSEADSLAKLGYAVRVEAHIGDPAQRIIDFVNDVGVDLVAMATHGRSGIGRLVLGSVAEKVLRGITVPVLMLRTANEPEPQRTAGEELAMSLGNGRRLRIATATDGSTHARKGMVEARKLADLLGAQLTVLVVANEQSEPSYRATLMDEAQRVVEGMTPKAELIALVGYADELILRHLNKEPADMLYMGAFQDRGAGSATAIGPTAQRLAQHAPASLYMFKGHGQPVRRILACVAVDDSVVVDVAAELARATKAELQVLHVMPPAVASYLAPSPLHDAGLDDDIPVTGMLEQGTHLAEKLHQWMEQLENRGLQPAEAMILKRGSVPETVLKAAHEGRYDLIVVGSQSGPGHFLGSVANSIVRYAEQSVLVVRTRQL